MAAPPPDARAGRFKLVSTPNPSEFPSASNVNPEPEPRSAAWPPSGFAPSTLGIRDVRFYRASDALSGILILGMVIFGPWAFGTTQPATIRIMNLADYTLGLLLAVKWFIRHFKGYRPCRWGGDLTPATTALTRALAALILAAALAGPGEAAAPKAAGNPFGQLSGNWKGGGTVTTATTSVRR